MSIFLRAFAAASLLAAPAGAMTFNITMAGQTRTFEAEAGGGPISGFSITLGGTLFDTLLPPPDTPTYDPVDNDFKAADGGIFSYVTNSTAGPGCLVSDCRLEFEDRADPEVPPVWAAFSLSDLEVFALGFYEIEPAAPGPDGVVPLPAPAVLLVAALAALGAVSGRRRGAI